MAIRTPIELSVLKGDEKYRLLLDLTYFSLGTETFCGALRKIITSKTIITT